MVAKQNYNHADHISPNVELSMFGHESLMR